MLNPITNFYGRDSGESELLNQLNIELIQNFGFDCYYLPRTMNSEDYLYGESAQNTFSKALPIEMMLLTTSAFEGSQEFIGKMGMIIQQSMSLSVSRQRFKEEFLTTTGREAPLEGDLVYIPLLNFMYAIKYVDRGTPMRQLGNKYVWKLDIDKYQHDHAYFATGIPEIDRINPKGSLAKVSAGGPGVRTTVNGIDKLNDITKEAGAVNVGVEIEADGTDEDMFTDSTQKILRIDPSDPNKAFLERITRGTGVISHSGGNGTIINDSYNNY